MSIPLSIDEKAIAALCRRHHIHRLSLFGSVLRDDFRDDSDVDVLVEFEAERIPGLGILDVEAELSALLGRGADVVTEGALNRWFRGRVLKSRVMLYDAA